MDHNQTSQPILPFCEGAWRVPGWCFDLGYTRNSQVLRLIKARASLIARAQMDGIEHVAPVLLALGCSPADAKKRVGKAVWRKVHHSDLSLNVARANVMIRSRIKLADLVEFPNGALREALSNVRKTDEDTVIAAGLIARNRTEFRHAVMLVHDAKRMGGDIDRRWSLRRLREEHDRRAAEWARAKSDPTPWGEPWSCEMDGFRFRLLNSFADFSEEGHTMHHCVASYAQDAKSGRYIIMRIDGRERATVRFGGHPVRVLEVRRRFNAAVSTACRDACAKVCAEHLRSVPKKSAAHA